MSDFLQQGGGFPSAATPFSMDLATPIMAITQQMVRRRKDEIAADKTIVSDNEAMMLKALDFETVKGMSDKLQVEHVQAIDDLSTKWAGEFSKYQGKLPNTKKLELMHDQRAMETDVNNKKANVLAFTKLQTFMQEHPKEFDASFDREATIKNMSNWIDSGRVGADGAAFLAVPKQFTGSQITMRDYGDMFKLFKGERGEAIKNAAPGQVETITKSYGEKAAKMMQTVLSNPDLNTPEKLADAQRLGSSILGDVTVQKYNRPVQPRPGVDKSAEAIKTAQPGNDMLHQAWLHSGGSEDAFVKGGIFQSAKWRNDKDKGWTFDVVKFDGTKAAFPESMGEKGWKIAVNDFNPTSAKVSKAVNIQTGQTTPRENTPTVPETIPQFRDLVKNFDKTQTFNSVEYDNRDLIVTQINNAFPGGWEATKAGIIKGKGPSGSINITEPNGTIHVFNLKIPGKREELQKFYEDNSTEGAAYKKLTGDKIIVNSRDEGIKVLKDAGYTQAEAESAYDGAAKK